VAEQLKQKAFNELADTEVQLERSKSAARISQIVDYCFFLIHGFIGLEVFLQMIGARQDNSFKILIDAINRPLVAPFKAIVPSLTFGRYEMNFSYVLALIVYAMLHPAIKGLLRIIAHRRTRV